MKKNFHLLIVAVIFMASCSYFSKYPGYKKTWNGIYYKLLTIGEDNRHAEAGDYITIAITYKTINDSAFFSGRRRFQLTMPDYKGSIDECFTMISKGEKAEFIIDAKKFFQRTLQTGLPSFIKQNDDMKVEIEMVDIQTATAYENEKRAFLKWIDDFGDYEHEILSQYMREQKLSIQPTANGLYFIKLNNGNGKTVSKGDTLIVEYEGKFLDGKFFDSTIKRHEAFSFVYGTEWQVVKGLEEAFGMMQEGEKALVILPSDLAFGKSGSSTGIVPPFTSLIFEIELKKIIKP